MVKPVNEDTDPSNDPELAEMLVEYADVFEAPGVADHRSETPECIPLLPDVSPVNRPAFRL
jgi:hypothetical protein